MLTRKLFNFTGSLDRTVGATIFFITEEAKKTVLENSFFQKEQLKYYDFILF